jgi:hypothetical protein
MKKQEKFMQIINDKKQKPNQRTKINRLQFKIERNSS